MVEQADQGGEVLGYLLRVGLVVGQLRVELLDPHPGVLLVAGTVLTGPAAPVHLARVEIAAYGRERGVHLVVGQQMTCVLQREQHTEAADGVVDETGGRRLTDLEADVPVLAVVLELRGLVAHQPPQQLDAPLVGLFGQGLCEGPNGRAA